MIQFKGVITNYCLHELTIHSRRFTKQKQSQGIPILNNLLVQEMLLIVLRDCFVHVNHI